VNNLPKEIDMSRYKPGAPEGAPKFQELYDAINELPEWDRVLIHWVYWDGLSLREVARRTEVTHPAVLKQHERILRDLRRTLAGSTLGDTRLYADGTAWIRCRVCKKWGEEKRICSCGAADIGSFDFPVHVVDRVTTPVIHGAPDEAEKWLKENDPKYKERNWV
jgi:hypothetical protein